MPPPFALPCWADEHSFYVQVPRSNGPPVVISYTHANMTRALPLLAQNFRDTPRPVAIPAAPVSSLSAFAKEMLRRRGIIG